MMMSAKAKPDAPLANGQWWVATPGELMKIRVTSDETAGIYTIFEAVAEPRNGVPMHVHASEDEHFLVLEGTLHMANGSEKLDVPAGATVTVKKGVPHLGQSGGNSRSLSDHFFTGAHRGNVHGNCRGGG
jgi:mannose-6-phosphate isomerase-like protein (cupin superfamily)